MPDRTSQQFPDRTPFLWLVAVGVLLSGGCGKGEYDRRLEQRISGLRTEATAEKPVVEEKAPTLEDIEREEAERQAAERAENGDDGSTTGDEEATSEDAEAAADEEPTEEAPAE